MPDVEPRFVDAGDAENDDGTRLFSALSNALADVPPDRLAGVVMVTDGVVHDIPASTALLGFRAPLHALVTGRPDERDRRIALTEAPRFGIVGKDQTVRAQVLERGGTGSALVTVRRDGQQILRREVRTGAPFSLTVRIEHGGPNVVEIEAEALAGRAHDREQPRRRHDRGHPREAARAARLRRAACRRAHLAQPPEVGRQRRPRPLHHPAPAREAGRHADQRAVADRLPDARAVPAEDQGVRPHHLRPLREPERPALDLFRQHRALRARGRRRAGRGRTRIRRRLEPCPHAPVADHPRRRRTGASSRSRTGPASPTGGKRHPVTRELPGSEQTPACLGRVAAPRRRPGPHRLGRDVGRRRPAAPGACPRGQGPGRAPALRPRLAVGARLSRRRPASRPPAPPRPLADEGAGARGGGAARDAPPGATSISSARPWPRPRTP